MTPDRMRLVVASCMLAVSGALTFSLVENARRAPVAAVAPNRWVVVDRSPDTAAFPMVLDQQTGTLCRPDGYIVPRVRCVDMQQRIAFEAAIPKFKPSDHVVGPFDDLIPKSGRAPSTEHKSP